MNELRGAKLTFGLAAGLAIVAVHGIARADETAACVKASEQAQSLRDEGKYRSAREQLLLCSRDVCPSVVRKDCVTWLADVDAAMPSIVLGAKDGAQDVVDVKVSLDGKPLAEKLDGKPLPMDAGEHTITFERQGRPAVQSKVVLHAGEKNRAISVQLGAEPNAAGGGGARGGGGGTAEQSSSGPPIAGYVVGGIGVVAIGGFAFFGLSGKSDVDNMRSGPNACAPNCDPSKVDAAKAKLLVADISLGVGVVGLGVATYLILTHGKSNEPESAAKPEAEAKDARPRLRLTSFELTPTRGGGYASFGASF
jgi:hypothetical protein